MTIDHADIEKVAPDQASLNAARKLLKQTKWSLLAEDSAKTLLWGSCQGSGATPYSVTVDRSDLGAKCSCPSRKFPCKHAIALMWWYADQQELFATGEVPEFVSTWLGRRRGGAVKNDDAKPKLAKSMAKSATTKEKTVDKKKSAKASARLRAQREVSILSGLDELDVWIVDQVESGLGGFASRGREQCTLMSQRLVDAKASGLATQVQEIGSDYYATPQLHRPDYLINALGRLHLLSSAYRRQSCLSEEMVADVRRYVGWSMTRDELLLSTSAPRVSGHWITLANRSVTQIDRLIRRETWLLNSDVSASRRFAVLQDFVPAAVAGGSAPALASGHCVEAELVYYPSVTPLRAQIVQQKEVVIQKALPAFDEDDASVHESFQQALVVNPWLDYVPVQFTGLLKRDKTSQLWLETSTDTLAVDGSSARALLGAGTLKGVALYDGDSLCLLAADCELGTWWSVPL